MTAVHVVWLIDNRSASVWEFMPLHLLIWPSLRLGEGVVVIGDDEAVLAMSDPSVRGGGRAVLAREVEDTVVGLAAGIGRSGTLDLGTSGRGASTVETPSFLYPWVAHELGHSLGLSHTDADPFFGVNGFMAKAAPNAGYAVLGPTILAELGAGYEQANQWYNWALRIGEKLVPRPNAFELTGCDDDDECPPGTICWNAGPTGICRDL